MQRRQFLQTLSTAPLVYSLPIMAASPQRQLQAEITTAQIAPDGYPRTEVWTYNGTVPGQLIAAKKGEVIDLQFNNALPEGTSVHWHGIRIANAMDGVPGLTQSMVKPGSRFHYRFTVPDAGTYWYHSHNRSWIQMAKGLSGPMIIQEHIPPEVDRDQIIVIDDWRLNDDGQLHEPFGSMRDHSHAGRLGNWVTVNGRKRIDARLKVKQNERLRLRLINTSNARIYQLFPEGLNAWVVALDGQPLSKVEPAYQVALAPAQRVDLIVDVTGAEGQTAFLRAQQQDQLSDIFAFEIDGVKRTQALDTPLPLPPNDVPVVDSISTIPVTELVMAGGAMGSMQTAVMNGKEMSIRELVAQGMAWSFNGVSGMPEEPLLQVKRDQPVRIRMINNTRWAHAMHLHGHHFQEVLADDQTGPLRDTILMSPQQSMDIVFVADNPGVWLFHCHMLEHQAAGMKTRIVVV